MFKNIKDIRTTLPSLVGALLTILGVTGFIDMESVPSLNDALVAFGFSILTLVGLLSSSK